MVRIYAGLVISYAVVVLASATCGFLVQDDRSFVVHFALGLFATLFTCFLYCVVVTYFIITGKMIKQAVLQAGLSEELIRRSQGFKGAAISIAMLASAAALGAAAVGAWAGYSPDHTAQRAAFHLVAESGAVALNLVVMLLAYRLIVTNAELVDHVFGIFQQHGPAKTAS